MGGLGAGEVQGGERRHLQGRESLGGEQVENMQRLYVGQSGEVCFHQIAAALLP